MLYEVTYKRGKKFVDVPTAGYRLTTYEVARAAKLKTVSEAKIVMTKVNEATARKYYSECADVFVKYKGEDSVLHLNNNWGGHAPLESYFYRAFDLERVEAFYVNKRKEDVVCM